MNAEEIKKVVSGEVTTEEKILEKDSRDTSIFEVKPAVVVAPQDSDDVEKLVGLVIKNKGASLTARAAGTDMTGGPLTDSILLDFTPHFNHIKEIGPDYVVVEPGVYFRDLEKALAERGLWYPPYPASKDMAAMGGIVNNDSGGEKTLRYGKTHDYVEELGMILADGRRYQIGKSAPGEGMALEIYRKISELLMANRELVEKTKPTVSKNSSGYNIWGAFQPDGKIDLTKLIIGAQGTLGIMTEAKLKVIPKEKFDKLYIVFINDLAVLPQFTKDVLALKPTSLEITDDHTFKIYLRYAREMAEVLGVGGILGTAKLFFPEAMLILTGGIPKLILLVEFEGNDEGVELEEIKQMEEIVKKYHLRGRFAKTQLEMDKYWKLRRDTLKLLREKVKGAYPTPFIDDLEVHPDDLPDFWPKLTKLLDENKIIYTISGHLGDGNLHIIPLMNMKDPQTKEKIYEIAPQVYDLVESYHGSITAEHNDGLMRGPYLEKEFGPEVFGIFREIKNIFDPENIFNPHKKTMATMEWSKSHVRIS